MKQFSLILLLLFSSCVSEVDIALVENEKVVTVNCILSPDIDTIVAHVSYSRDALSSENFKPIDDATIKLFEEGRLIGKFKKSDSTAWRLNHTIEPGKSYNLEVFINDKTLWAETTVPEKLNAKISSLEIVTYRYDYNVSFLNNPKSFYWISAKGYAHYKGEPTFDRAPGFYSSYSYADDFNRYLETWAGYRYSYEDYIRIAGNTFQSDSINCQFVPSTIDINLGPQEVFVFSVDYHLDKYMKSSLLMEENDLWAEDVPIVYAPFPVYSNIHGGTGIFGSFSSVSKVFTKE
jgi:hypothetical protein